METQKRNNGYMVVGLLLILLGAAFLVTTFGVAGLDWGTIWPAYLIIIGAMPIVAAFAEQQDNPGHSALPVMGGSLLVMLGVFFFATTLDFISWSQQATLWPLYMIIFGLAALVGYVTSGKERTGYLATGLLFSLVGGGLLVATLSGLLYDIHWSWFDNIGTWFEVGWMVTWWPVFPIVAGLIFLTASLVPDNPGARGVFAFVGTLPLLVGIFFQATTLGFLSWSDQGRLWPIYPLILAVSCLVSYFSSDGEYRFLLIAAGLFGTVGLVFLPLSLISFSLIGYLWPLLLVAAGILLLIPWAQGRGGMLGHR